MNLKELIESCDWEKTYLYIHLKDASNAVPSVIEDVVRCYSGVINELLSNKPTLPYHFKIAVKTELDWYYTYILENPDEIKLATNTIKFLSDGKTLDKSKYEYMDVSFVSIEPGVEVCGCLSPWSEMLSMPIVNELNLSNEALLGEILWELTFYGFSEKKTKDFWDTIQTTANDLK
jgi:hypothetical protein